MASPQSCGCSPCEKDSLKSVAREHNISSAVISINFVGMSLYTADFRKSRAERSFLTSSRVVMISFSCCCCGCCLALFKVEFQKRPKPNDNGPTDNIIIIIIHTYPPDEYAWPMHHGDPRIQTSICSLSNTSKQARKDK